MERGGTHLTVLDIQSEGGIVCIRFTHSPTVDEVLASFAPVNALDDSNLRLWSFLDGLAWTREELDRVVTFTRKQVPQPQRVAVVSAQPLGFGLMRMFKAYRDGDGGTDISVFRDEPTAKAFLLNPD